MKHIKKYNEDNNWRNRFNIEDHMFGLLVEHGKMEQHWNIFKKVIYLKETHLIQINSLQMLGR